MNAQTKYKNLFINVKQTYDNLKTENDKNNVSKLSHLKRLQMKLMIKM